MEKERFRIVPTGLGHSFSTPLTPQSRNSLSDTSIGGTKIYKTLEEAFAAFDNLEEENRFVVNEASREEPYLIKNALLLIDGGEFSLARNLLGQVLRRNYRSVEAIRWTGWCFKQEGLLENAQKCYEQLVQLRVTDQDLFELGEIYYEQKRNDLALVTWLRALEGCDAESPRLFDLHKNLGNVYTRQGDYESAEENYNKALTLRPRSDILQINLGTLAFQRQSYLQALTHFKQGLEFNPFNDSGWCGVALVAREMKDIDWGRAALLKALDINPNNLTALQILIQWAFSDCRFVEAISRTQGYCNKRQEDVAMGFSLAGLLFQSGDSQSADAELKRIETSHPDYPGLSELRKLIDKKLERHGA